MKLFKRFTERGRYVRAMIKAIESAAHNVWNEDNPSAKTDGLRVIKTFERVNNISFDPFSEHHVFMVRGHGCDERFLRRAKQILGMES